MSLLVIFILVAALLGVLSLTVLAVLARKGLLARGEPNPDPGPERICPRCGAPLAGDSYYCPACGRPATLLCPRCQRPLDDETLSCQSCGLPAGPGSTAERREP